MQGTTDWNSQPNSLSEAKRRLLDALRTRILRSQTAAPAITRRPPKLQAPLSLVQEQVWREASSNMGVPSFYNESITIHRTGQLDREALERGFTEIIRRHEAWRTTFDVVEGQPIQVIHPAPSRVAVPFVDLRRFVQGSREREALRLATNEARRPFDLKHGPLIRALLTTIDDRKHLFFLTMHQSIVDGVSVYQIFPSELVTLYVAFSKGRPSPLPDLPIQYADFAYWERQFNRKEALAQDIAYWREQFASRPRPIKWPSRKPEVPSERFLGTIRPFTIPPHLSHQLKAFSEHEGVTLFMALLAIFAALLFRNTAQKDVVVGTVAPAGRKRPELQQLLGYFLNPLGLRIDLSGDPTIRELLRRCREVTCGALSHDDTPAEQIVRELKPPMDPDYDSLFHMVITLAPSLPHLNSGWSQTPMDVDSGWSKWDLYLEFSDRPNGIIGRAQYRTSVFTSAMISKLLHHFERVLEFFTTNSEQRLSDLPRFMRQTAGLG